MNLVPLCCCTGSTGNIYEFFGVVTLNIRWNRIVFEFRIDFFVNGLKDFYGGFSPQPNVKSSILIRSWTFLFEIQLQINFLNREYGMKRNVKLIVIQFGCEFGKRH